MKMSIAKITTFTVISIVTLTFSAVLFTSSLKASKILRLMMVVPRTKYNTYMNVLIRVHFFLSFSNFSNV